MCVRERERCTDEKMEKRWRIEREMAMCLLEGKKGERDSIGG